MTDVVQELEFAINLRSVGEMLAEFEWSSQREHTAYRASEQFLPKRWSVINRSLTKYRL